MSSHDIIDSHVHLWPSETSNEAGHAWMTTGNPLAKPHLLPHYQRAIEVDQNQPQSLSTSAVKGIVYVETDVRYDEPSTDLSSWAKGPLDEISFLRDVVEGRHPGYEITPLVGLVPWAPMTQSNGTLRQYLHLARQSAGPKTWPLVKGFRYLLQSIRDEQTLTRTVLADSFIANLQTLGEQHFSFDVGVDQRSAGTFQLDLIHRAISRAHEGVSDDVKTVFIINHLCKPDFTSPETPEFVEWARLMTALARQAKTYIKLSGAFSELDPGEFKTVEQVAAHIRPWVDHVWKSFGAERVMFGSDWPVCNVQGLSGENSWRDWKAVVQVLLDDERLVMSEAQKGWVWARTAQEAYRL